jgi:hypothetical protein
VWPPNRDVNMTKTALRLCGRSPAGLSLLVGLSVLTGYPNVVSAQPPPVPPLGVVNNTPDLQRAPVLPTDLSALTPPTTPSSAKNSRIQLFRIQPGFLVDPLGVMDDDPTPTDPSAPASKDDTDWLNVTLGYDNPYFDMRQRGDPGGIGFYRVSSQVQLFDTDRTAFSFGVHAFTPAGLQFNGLADSQGSTVLSPALALYHALDEDTAVQGYVSKNVMVQQSAVNPVDQNVRYGMALQRSLNTVGAEPLKNVYLSVGAVGTVRIADTTLPATRQPAAWEVLPGLHWKVADNCWVSGSYVVPVGNSNNNTPNNWQFTCRFQF